MHFLSVELIIERMKNEVGLKNNKDLAELLRVPASTLSNWKTKNSMPLEVIAEFAQKNNSDLNWLVFDQEKSSELASDARMALLAFNDLDDRKKLEAIAFMTGLKTSSPQTGAITQHVSGSKNNVVGNGHIRIEKND